MLTDKYLQWKEYATDDTDLVQELELIGNDPSAIRDRFYRDLDFGTGGLRGIMGAGTNRMNLYTVRAATFGLQYQIQDNIVLTLRPSGTEPKLKFYYSVISSNRDKATRVSHILSEYCRKLIEGRNLKLFN